MPKTKLNHVYFDYKQKKILNDKEIQIIRNKQKSLSDQNIEFFSSSLECETYKILTRFCLQEELERHYKLTVFPKTICYPNGKTWTVDFLVKANKSLARMPIIVQVGESLSDHFLANLASLEVNYPGIFASLCLVYKDSIPRKRILNDLLSRQARGRTRQPKIFTLEKFEAFFANQYI